jgi:hypothetical protein
MSELMSLLCHLVRNDAVWQWLPVHNEAFNKLKVVVSTAPALASFDSAKKITLQCDASQHGLGCCIFPNSNGNKLQLVACASRSLNKSELNYSQSEKELLATQFGTKKFHNYIYGANINVQTDHKPLVPIMQKNISKIGSVRLKRIRLKLLKYNLSVYYVPDKYLYCVDLLSRSHLKETSYDPEMLEMVHSISKHIYMSEVRQEQFEKETASDPTLSAIYKFYLYGWPAIDKIPECCIPYLR